MVCGENGCVVWRVLVFLLVEWGNMNIKYMSKNIIGVSVGYFSCILHRFFSQCKEILA